MKYVLSGSAGHITTPLAEKLLAAGHQVTVIGRSAEKLSGLVAKGATAAIGSVEDIAFLTRTYTGADAVYTMVPPNFGAANWVAYIAGVGENYAKAIQAAGIKYVVNLSSVGADLGEGAGPVDGLSRVEGTLDALEGVNVVHLRAAYFYQNLLSNIGLIKQAGIIGGNFAVADNTFLLVDPRDIAEAAFAELTSLSFKGRTVRYVISDEVSTPGVGSTLGAAIGKPDLSWVAFTDDQALQGMLQAGLSEEIAKNYVKMGQALTSGAMSRHYLKNRPAQLGKIKLGDFAKEFAEAYKAE